MTDDEVAAFPDNHTLRNAIDLGSMDPDLDSAVRGVQAVLGIKDGFTASMFFSDLHDEHWRQMDQFKRHERLIGYAVYEIQVDLVASIYKKEAA